MRVGENEKLKDNKGQNGVRGLRRDVFPRVLEELITVVNKKIKKYCTTTFIFVDVQSFDSMKRLQKRRGQMW